MTENVATAVKASRSLCSAKCAAISVFLNRLWALVRALPSHDWYEL